MNPVAERLTDESGPQEWGPFLVAGLYTGHILSTHPEPLSDSQQALELLLDKTRDTASNPEFLRQVQRSR